MIDSKVKEISEFCESNSDPMITKKYSKYFREGYDGFAIQQYLKQNFYHIKD
jgi:hypothetical protein